MERNMFCKHCGKEIDDKAVVCVHCGVPTDNMPSSGIMQNTFQYQPEKPVNGLAIAGLVVSIVGLFGGNYLFLIPSIVGLILSIVGMAKAKNHSLYGLAIAALIVSIIAFVIWLIIWIAAFAMILSVWQGGTVVM